MGWRVGLWWSTRRLGVGVCPFPPGLEWRRWEHTTSLALLRRDWDMQLKRAAARKKGYGWVDGCTGRSYLHLFQHSSKRDGDGAQASRQALEGLSPLPVLFLSLLSCFPAGFGIGNGEAERDYKRREANFNYWHLEGADLFFNP